AAARDAAERAASAVTVAEHEVEEARTKDRAATLRPHLRAGEPCPVCTQTVQTVPPQPKTPALTAANAALGAAEKDADSPARVVAGRDDTVRTLERTLAAANAQLGDVRTRLSTVDDQLAGAPEPSAIRATLTAIQELAGRVEAAGAEVRAARDAQRKAMTGV